jgi:hypothetical protein
MNEPDHQDSMPLQPLDRGGEVAAILDVELLVNLRQPFDSRRLETDEHPQASRLGSQSDQLFVVRHVDRHLGNPLLAKIRPNHRPEQVLRAGDVVRPGADEVVVDDQNVLLPNQLELLHHVLNRTVAKEPTVEGSHAAEAAIQRATSRGLDGTQAIADR